MNSISLKNKVLVVDDDESMGVLLQTILKKDYQVFLAKNLAEARECLKREYIQLVLLDICLGEENGLVLLSEIKQQHEGVEVVVISAVKEISIAVQAMKDGAYDYITKDFDYEELKLLVEKALYKIEQGREIEYLKEEVKQLSDSNMIFGSSQEMRRVQEMADRVAPLPATILILGETGSGKELMARYIHAQSHLANAPFVTVNMAAIPPDLIESTLFGHEKGSFTSADRTHRGKFELANGGTLFLDEIGDLRLDLQSKLLRALQENEIERVGGTKVIPVQIRLITATHCDLKAKVAKKEFREDLYYRLNVVPVELPPLRNRIQDIPLLMNHFIKLYNRKFNRRVNYVSPEVERVLMTYSWPGNIRELEHLIERMVALCQKDHLSLSDIPLEYQIMPVEYSDMDEGDLLQKTLDAFEKTYLLRILEENAFNQTMTSKMLGIHRKTLEYKIKRLALGEVIGNERVKLQ